MNNFNSFNTQPKCLEKEVDKFGNLTYDKTGTNLDNLVDDLRTAIGKEVLLLQLMRIKILYFKGLLVREAGLQTLGKNRFHLC